MVASFAAIMALSACGTVDARCYYDGQPLVDYSYCGGKRWLEKRRTSATAPNTVYETAWGYDSHQRVNQVRNSLDLNGQVDTVAQYGFTHDNDGNPLSQTSTGWAAFADDNRTFGVDALQRERSTAYLHGTTTELNVLDAVGNRESFTDRVGQITAYTLADPANEYATIGGTTVTYDAAGNLAVDENLRTYSYDEHNRLTQVQAAGGTLLASYTYDALGRRTTAQIGSTTSRCYYDGQNVIEERDGADALTAYHVNGAQYVDERIASYDVGPGAFAYYLHNLNYSIAGAGNADGSVVERVEYTPGGDFPPFCWKADSNCDGTVDFADIDAFTLALSDRPAWEVRYACDYDCVNDVNGDGLVDFNDIDPFVACLAGGCGGNWGGPPPSGTFVMHGRAVDVLPDGKVLMDFRTRSYDPQHGRWLQRDRSGYADGGNLYESFHANAQRFTDPDARYTRLASGWNSGDQVVYQRFPWLWSDEPSDSFSVGRYYHYKGEKLVLFDDRLDEYAYALPFAAVEQWSRGVHGKWDYSEYVHRYGTQIDRTTGKVVNRSTLDQLTIAIQDEMAAHTLSIDFLDPVVFFAGPAFTTMTAETAPGLLVEETRTVTRPEYVLAAATTVLQVVPIGQVGTKVLGSASRVALVVEPGAVAGQLEANVARGLAFEGRAAESYAAQGWKLLSTQYQQGAVLRGLDFAAYRTTAAGAELVLVESKASAGLVSAGRFTSLGLGRGGASVWQKNLQMIREAIPAQVGERGLRRELIGALDRAPIRLVGPEGFRVTPDTLRLIESTTGRSVDVIIVP